MLISFEKSVILDALRELDRRDARRRVFGADVHDYRLNPPIAESGVLDVERRYGISFPGDYRYFVTEIGNGGAGPFYGVFPFGTEDDDPSCSWDEGTLLGDLSAEFPHTEAWNLPESYWEQWEIPFDISEEEEERLVKQRGEIWERPDWNRDVMNGAIPICHQGCNHRIWLVVNGPEKGHLWCDHRTNDEGICPLGWPRARRVTFSQWYTTWLAEPSDHDRLVGRYQP